MQPRLTHGMDTLAKRVKAARARIKGMRQEDLAEQAGMKQGDISKIENGKILKTTGIVSLARALRVDPHWLETGEGDATPETVWPFALLKPEHVQALTQKQLAMVEKFAFDLLEMSSEQASYTQGTETAPPKVGSSKTWELTTRRKKRSGTSDSAKATSRQSRGG